MRRFQVQLHRKEGQSSKLNCKHILTSTFLNVCIQMLPWGHSSDIRKGIRNRETTCIRGFLVSSASSTSNHLEKPPEMYSPHALWVNVQPGPLLASGTPRCKRDSWQSSHVLAFCSMAWSNFDHHMYHITSSTSSAESIEKLQAIFALPQTIVSDNATSFSVQNSSSLYRRTGFTSAPYYLSPREPCRPSSKA